MNETNSTRPLRQQKRQTQKMQRFRNIIYGLFTSDGGRLLLKVIILAAVIAIILFYGYNAELNISGSGLNIKLNASS